MKSFLTLLAVGVIALAVFAASVLMAGFDIGTTEPGEAVSYLVMALVYDPFLAAGFVTSAYTLLVFAASIFTRLTDTPTVAGSRVWLWFYVDVVERLAILGGKAKDTSKSDSELLEEITDRALTTEPSFREKMDICVASATLKRACAR